jgi:colanic acid biosynthesis protein WcaH
MLMNNWIDQSLYDKIRDQMPIPCVDLLIVYNDQLLLMLRNNEPAKNIWFTPGGRIRNNESLPDVVSKVLKKETGLKAKEIRQVGTMSHVWPKIHTVTTYYSVKVDSDELIVNDEHRDVKWVSTVSEYHPYIQKMAEDCNIF